MTGRDGGKIQRDWGTGPGRMSVTRQSAQREARARLRPKGAADPPAALPHEHAARMRLKGNVERCFARLYAGLLLSCGQRPTAVPQATIKCELNTHSSGGLMDKPSTDCHFRISVSAYRVFLSLYRCPADCAKYFI